MTGDAGPARLAEALESALSAAGAPEGFSPALERPRDPTHGDWASNAALVLAKSLGQPPRALAARVCELIDSEAAGIAAVEVAGPGFLNFRLSDRSIWRRLAGVIEAGRDWGRTRASPVLRVNVEFVSANPTGPLHVAHGRGAALGDAVASLLEWAGHEVTREFYVNDAGRQIELLGESVEARYEETAGRPAAIPEGGYHGEYVRDVALAVRDAAGPGVLASLSPDERRAHFRREAVRLLRDEQAEDLSRFGVHMDLYYSERSLYESGAIDRLLDALEAGGLIYRSQGATWLRTSSLGDEKDRVLIKSDGSFTYFLPDLAYHLDKARRGFELAIDVWGADHQGHEKRMLAALRGLSYPELLEVLIIQLVTVLRDGREVRMSKRAGRFVTLGELVDETGPDVARYFFLMRRAEVHLNFDLDLALDTSDANPVYKVQYAHARMCSVFRRAGIVADEVPAALDVPETFGTPAEREVALSVMRLPEVIATAAAGRAPHLVCTYLEETAGLVNAWYHQGNLNPAQRILADVPERAARIRLARAVQLTLGNGLRALGLSAPETMTREDT
ncbi:MAG: arginine--tRNA ligase [Gemmatimonadota bacterium]|uniref:arginine--tRNA ligase n=1 Tax=Candidatus Palauibacter scopulicola TaxID=3056741 RepID=UPI00238CEB01|nr:arginine--tRNA ligase [Candidatus Palauibacter scopulicola]MDE2664005.1 arginine--tRNA ligase [Candidatus Palauibacter scopulicola]